MFSIYLEVDPHPLPAVLIHQLVKLGDVMVVDGIARPGGICEVHFIVPCLNHRIHCLNKILSLALVEGLRTVFCEGSMEFRLR